MCYSCTSSGNAGGFVVLWHRPCVWDGGEVLLEHHPGRCFRIRTARSEPLWLRVGWKTGSRAFWVGWCVTVTVFEEVLVSCFPSQAWVISVMENPGPWLGLESGSDQTQALRPASALSPWPRSCQDTSFRALHSHLPFAVGC